MVRVGLPVGPLVLVRLGVAVLDTGGGVPGLTVGTMVLVRHEAGAFAQTSRRVRRKLVRGVDRVEHKLEDLETLYDVVHGEVEDTALDVAATLRSVRRGNGMLGRVRRVLAAGRA